MSIDAHEEAVEGRRRLSADERRAQIVAAARPIFAERGFHGVSTADLALAAGCSEPMLYKHFPSKQALFAAVLVDASLTMRQRFADVENEPDPLGAYVGRLCTSVADPVAAQVFRLRSFALALLHVPEIRDVIRQSVEGQHGKARAVLAHAQANGQTDPDLDADAAAWLVVGVSLVATTRAALDGPDALADMPRIQAELARLVQAPATGAPTPEGDPA